MKANHDLPNCLFQYHDGACNHLGLLGVQARDDVALGEWGEPFQPKAVARSS